MLLHIKRIAPDLLLGLWQLEQPKGRVTTSREIERQAEADLLAAMLGRQVVLEHDDNGKPALIGYNISISHTKGFLAIMLSKVHKVGIDIEYPSERVLKIASRFLRDDEPYATDATKCLYAWCVKEALYKLQSSSQLTYQEMRVDAYAGRVDDLKNQMTFPVYTHQTEQYLLVWLYTLDY